jgi:hypothetical protein
MSHWRTKSRKVILAALEEADAAGLEGKAREKFVSDRYPFGERAMHPYQIWLNEFSLLVRGVRKPMTKSKAKGGPKLLGEWPGQGDLFAKD